MTAGFATWILTYSLHSVVLCVLALAATRWLRLSAAARCVVLRSAIFLPFATATIAVTGLTRAGALASKAVSVTSAVRPLFPASMGMQKVEMKITTINGRPPERALEVEDPVAAALARIIVLLAVAISAGGLALHRHRTRRLRRALEERTSSKAAVPLALQHGIRISESSLIDVPVALRGKEICIPATSFAGMSFAEQQSVMLHELAHVDRNDPSWMDASRIVSAGTGWQPLVRVVCESLERETELAADQRAIALGARPHALVAGLAHFAGLVNPGYAGAGAALLRGDSPLVTRARLLLEPPATPRTLPITLVWAAIISVLAFSAIAPLPTAASAAPSPAISGKAGTSRLVEEERVVTFRGNQRQP